MSNSVGALNSIVDISKLQIQHFIYWEPTLRLQNIPVLQPASRRLRLRVVAVRSIALHIQLIALGIIAAQLLRNIKQTPWGHGSNTYGKWPIEIDGLPGFTY